MIRFRLTLAAAVIVDAPASITADTTTVAVQM